MRNCIKKERLKVSAPRPLSKCSPVSESFTRDSRYF